MSACVSVLDTESSADSEAALLLAHGAQALLLVAPDLRVGSVYNPAAEHALQRCPAGVSIDELLAPDDLSIRHAVRQSLLDALHEPDPERCRLFLDLLPPTLDLHERVWQLTTRRVPQGVVVILTDLTEQLILQEQWQQQHQLLELVRTALQDRSALQAAVHDLERLFSAHEEGVLPGPGLRRQVHTHKGVLAQLGFYAVPAVLHAAEAALPNLPAHELDWCAAWQGPVQEALAEDLAALGDVVGERLDDAAEGVWWSAQTAQQVEAWALAQGHAEGADATVLQALSRLTAVSLHGELRRYERMMQRLARALGKALQPMQIRGPDLWLRDAGLRAVVQSLVHVFRNAVDHGIESPDERRAVNKPPAGRVLCHVQLEGPDHWALAIEDDGAGIDAAALRERVMAAGLDPNQGELLDWVFAEGISSRDDVTWISGRGVGLAALRAAVEQVNGTITLANEAGQGTCLRIVLPRLMADLEHKESDDDLGRNVAS